MPKPANNASDRPQLRRCTIIIGMDASRFIGMDAFRFVDKRRAINRSSSPNAD
jgi:hypothetical protein